MVLPAIIIGRIWWGSIRANLLTASLQLIFVPSWGWFVAISSGWNWWKAVALSYQQVGASPHCANRCRNIRNYIEIFWTCDQSHSNHGHAVCGLDLSPLDYRFWGEMQTVVYLFCEGNASCRVLVKDCISQQSQASRRTYCRCSHRGEDSLFSGKFLDENPQIHR